MSLKFYRDGREMQLSVMLSNRGERILAMRNFVDDEWIRSFSKNLYDPNSNPKGIISLASAENTLCDDILTVKLTECLPKCFNKQWLHYPPCTWGTLRFRETICGILNDYFNPTGPVHADNLIAASGATALLSMIFMAVADSGDYFLCLSPHYFRIERDLFDEAGVKSYSVPMNQISGTFGVEKIERFYLKAVLEGLTVKGLVLINPDNPTGKTYSGGDVVDILRFCKKYNLHVIADEVYALSTYGETKFESVLSIHGLPDPERTHFIWAPSKDFCMNGLKCGVIHTKNKDILTTLKSLSRYHSTTEQIQLLITNILSDKDWIRDVYLPTNKTRIKQAYKTGTDILDEIGVPYVKNTVACFIWADFSEFLDDISVEGEMELCEEFAANISGRHFDVYIYASPASISSAQLYSQYLQGVLAEFGNCSFC